MAPVGRSLICTVPVFATFSVPLVAVMLPPKVLAPLMKSEPAPPLVTLPVPLRTPFSVSVPVLMNEASVPMATVPAAFELTSVEVIDRFAALTAAVRLTDVPPVIETVDELALMGELMLTVSIPEAESPPESVSVPAPAKLSVWVARVLGSLTATDVTSWVAAVNVVVADTEPLAVTLPVASVVKVTESLAAW